LSCCRRRRCCRRGRRRLRGFRLRAPFGELAHVLAFVDRRNADRHVLAQRPRLALQQHRPDDGGDEREHDRADQATAPAAFEFVEIEVGGLGHCLGFARSPVRRERGSHREERSEGDDSISLARRVDRRPPGARDVGRGAHRRRRHAGPGERREERLRRGAARSRKRRDGPAIDLPLHGGDDAVDVALQALDGRLLRGVDLNALMERPGAAQFRGLLRAVRRPPRQAKRLKRRLLG